MVPAISRRPLSLSRLNTRVFYELRRLPDTLVTLFAGVLDLARMEYTYASAGNVPALLVRSVPNRGGARRPERLQANGAGFGLVSETEYAMQAVNREPDDLILHITDGHTELRRPAGGEGPGAFERWLETVPNGSGGGWPPRSRPRLNEAARWGCAATTQH